MRFLSLIAFAILSGCAQQKFEWVRTDGQSGKNNPALASQFEIDKTICAGDMQKANLSGTNFCQGIGDCVGASIARDNAMQTVGKGCMAQRGYVLVPEDQAAAKNAEFAALRRAAPPQSTSLQH